MTIFLILLLIVSPLSSFFMLYNQYKLDKIFKAMKDDVQYLKDNSLLLSNCDLLKSLDKRKVEIPSVNFNVDE